MPDELLPPDPSKDGQYWWLRAPNGLDVPAQWRGYGWKVFGQHVAYGAQFMAEQGYSLASPHPIPTPERLNALHATLGEIDDEQAIFAKTAYQDADYGWLNGTINALRKIRAALGAKPDDPPGESI